MPEKKRVYIPDKGYDIQLKIKDLDYTSDLISVRLVSAISTAYQLVTLRIYLDPNDVILEDVMGKEPLKLSIRLIGRGGETVPSEDINLELQYIKHTTSVSPKTQQSDTKIPDRTILNIITVCRIPFKIMMSNVNDVFIENTIRQIISYLIKKNGGKVIYDTDGENKRIINQIVLPPMTLYKSIRYLDDNFGLYDGASNLGFCQYDGTVHIQNLTKRLNKNQEFTVYYLSVDNPENQEIINKCNDGKNFYSYTPIKSQSNAVVKQATMSRSINHIVKPNDSLYRVIEQKFDDVYKKLGSNFKSKDIKFDSNLDVRETFNISHSGDDESNIFANVKVAREIAGLSTIELDLEKNLPILNLVKVGEPVKLKCSTLEYTPLSGKYLLKSSDLSFTRETKDWMTTCHLILMRTNQYT